MIYTLLTHNALFPNLYYQDFSQMILTLFPHNRTVFRHGVPYDHGRTNDAALNEVANDIECIGIIIYLEISHHKTKPPTYLP